MSQRKPGHTTHSPSTFTTWFHTSTLNKHSSDIPQTKNFDGINSAKPPHRILFIILDTSKAFDAIPRHNLMNKIYNINMHNNTKRWLANYLTSRNAQVLFADQISNI